MYYRYTKAKKNEQAVFLVHFKSTLLETNTHTHTHKDDENIIPECTTMPTMHHFCSRHSCPETDR